MLGVGSGVLRLASRVDGSGSQDLGASFASSNQRVNWSALKAHAIACQFSGLLLRNLK